MLGISATAQLALCEFPPTGGVRAGPAWRRLLAQVDPGARLNRGPPPWVWKDKKIEDEEDEAVALLLDL